MTLGFYYIGGEDGVFRGVAKEKYEGKRVPKVGCIFSETLGGSFCKSFK
ncbi:hypothetical protein ICM_04441 [Bacillus cereus BAG1X2-3]|nr:hypothetical protein ICC_00401 [Bacillus cereus BAG1X1-1]EOO45254.1 hypothetical protein ICI_04980 [Bacillus cereus BAG1X2-1]EOO55689.1 hypothetical protein ICK_00337 [Bacillus cereus BAG1X2-2]EOO56736.1 hypothetical protein ICM_04441 [Bacillus cereus BAG1X2-3]EOP02522.1 hypothetical protein ICO_04961 [Bacillus cereus BAG2O-1]